jgi:hypothetical protein
MKQFLQGALDYGHVLEIRVNLWLALGEGVQSPCVEPVMPPFRAEIEVDLGIKRLHLTACSVEPERRLLGIVQMAVFRQSPG